MLRSPRKKNPRWNPLVFMIGGTAREDFLAGSVTQCGDVEAMQAASCLNPVRGALRHSRLSAWNLRTPDMSFKQGDRRALLLEIWTDSP